MWQTIDTQQQLDELDAAVCWEDSRVVEFHGGSSPRPYYPTDVCRSGHDRLDIHLLVATPCSQLGSLLELCFIHCERLGADAFDRLHLHGRVDALRRVEIGSDGDTLLRCSRLIFRWHPSTQSELAPHHWSAS